MIDYLVKCPSAPYETTNCFGDLDRAWDLCLSLAEEYGYAEVGYYNVKGHYQLVGDYCFNWLLWKLRILVLSLVMMNSPSSVLNFSLKVTRLMMSRRQTIVFVIWWTINHINVSSDMIKTQVLKIIAKTASKHNLTREEKFQVFCNVCDNALHAGQITESQHKRWTNIFWSWLNLKHSPSSRGQDIPTLDIRKPVGVRVTTTSLIPNFKELMFLLI